MQFTITKIYTTDKNKDGSALVSKTGKPYTRMSIQVVEHGDKWISGFRNKDNSSWKVGDKVEAVIDTKTSGGKDYLNFTVAKPESVSTQEVSVLKTQVGSIVSRLNIIEERLGITKPSDYSKTVDTIEYPDEQINAEDIPF